MRDKHERRRRFRKEECPPGKRGDFEEERNKAPSPNHYTGREGWFLRRVDSYRFSWRLKNSNAGERKNIGTTALLTNGGGEGERKNNKHGMRGDIEKVQSKSSSLYGCIVIIEQRGHGPNKRKELSRGKGKSPQMKGQGVVSFMGGEVLKSAQLCLGMTAERKLGKPSVGPCISWRKASARSERKSRKKQMKCLRACEMLGKRGQVWERIGELVSEVPDSQEVRERRAPAVKSYYRQSCDEEYREE